jgi:protein-S-isoprenylcysteine O-methyltransferase Ste14
MWFHRGVRDDEARLEALFEAGYDRYSRRVRRWIPGVI